MNLKELCNELGLDEIPKPDDRRTLKIWELVCQNEPRFDDKGNRLMPLLLHDRYECVLRRIFDLVVVPDENSEPSATALESYRKFLENNPKIKKELDENRRKAEKEGKCIFQEAVM